MIGLMRRVLNGRENVFPLQVRIVGKDLVIRSAGAQKFEDVRHPNPQTANAWTATAFAGLDGDTV